MVECGKCGVYACYYGKLDKMPKFCPMRDSSNEEIYSFAKSEYLTDEVARNIALNAARVEAAGYTKWTRLEEIIEFARRCGFKKLGVAFCIGVRNEARILVDILEKKKKRLHRPLCDVQDWIGAERGNRFEGARKGQTRKVRSHL